MTIAQDKVQKSAISHFKYTIVGANLTVTFQRGPGVLTRTGAGALRITYPSGQGIDTLRQSVSARLTGATEGFATPTSTSDEQIDIAVTDNAGAALDNVPGEIDVTAILGD